MKKIIVCIMAAILSFTFIPNQAGAAPAARTVSVVTTEDANAKANALYARLNEIKEMDKTNLTAAQRKDLRKEVRDIKRQLTALDGIVYISAGALILILILLIILL